MNLGTICDPIGIFFIVLGFRLLTQAQAKAALTDAPRPLSTAALEARVDLSRSRLEMMLKVLDVDGAIRRVTGGWEATGYPASR